MANYREELKFRKELPIWGESEFFYPESRPELVLLRTASTHIHHQVFLA